MSFYFLETTAFAKLFVQEQGTKELIELLAAVEDNHKLIASSAPLEIHSAIRRRERAGTIPAEIATHILDSLGVEASRAVQQPLNPAVLEAARQLVDRTSLRWTDALQLGAALTARSMYQSMPIIFVSALPQMLEAAEAEGFEVIDTTKLKTKAKSKSKAKAAVEEDSTEEETEE